MRALARLAVFTLAQAIVCLSPDVALGQETASAVQVMTGAEVVSSASFALVAGPETAAATLQTFAITVQATITQVLVDPGGETQAWTQLGHFRTSILMKAGVLEFVGGQPAPPPAPNPEASPPLTGGQIQPQHPLPWRCVV